MKKKSPHKKDGSDAAARWLKQAAFQEVIDVAGQTAPNLTLDQLIESGYDVPSSNDREFSASFLRRVRSHVNGRFLHRRP